MPTYTYKCPECSFIEDQYHSFKDTPSFICPKCNGKQIIMEKQFSLNAGFIIKGESISKDWKEERYRVKRSAEMGVRQVERYGSGPRLRPNVAGVETESWSDAAKLASEAGLSPDSYQPLIEKENRTSKVSNVDDAKWKAAKEIKSNI